MIILASKSPRRKELMALLPYEFKAVSSGFDEKSVSEKIPERLVRTLAFGKASAVKKDYPDDIIIGCDTIVVSPENEIFGIPKDKADAIRMLKALSAKTHKVITGVCVLYGDKKTVFHKTTKVEFMPLSKEDIRWYISTGEPFDKAGAYGIQAKAGAFVKRINGDCNNVVGLPLQALKCVLDKIENL